MYVHIYIFAYEILFKKQIAWQLYHDTSTTMAAIRKPEVAAISRQWQCFSLILIRLACTAVLCQVLLFQTNRSNRWPYPETVTGTIFSSVMDLRESATFWDTGPEYLEGPELVSNSSTSCPYKFSFRGTDSDCKYRICLSKSAPFAWYRSSTSSALWLYCCYSVLLLV